MSVVVVKVGGSIVDRADAVLDEVVARGDVVLVHGFGPQTDAVCDRRGVGVRTLRSPSGVSSRFTDEAVLGAMREAAASVQASLVGSLEARGGRAVGLGVEEALFVGEAKPVLRHEREDGRVVLVRGNRSGRVVGVEDARVQRALAKGVPVVSPLARDEEGWVSVDADRAAAALGGALGASAVVLLTDVPGVLEDREDEGSVMGSLDVGAVEGLVGSSALGGMARKVVACREAVEGGVGRAIVASGLGEAPIEEALAGGGTEVVA